MALLGIKDNTSTALLYLNCLGCSSLSMLRRNIIFITAICAIFLIKLNYDGRRPGVYQWLN